jgi:hypothetical protein
MGGMKRSLGLVVAATLGTTACSMLGQETTEPRAMFFDPARADEIAAGALLDPRDLSGGGWEVTAENDFDDEDDPSFDAAIEAEPRCAGLEGLETLFGDDGDDAPPVGRAQRELSRVEESMLLPTSVQVEIEIFQTVAEVQGSWNLVRGLMEGDTFQECMRAMFAIAFTQGFTEDGGPQGVSVDVRPRETAAPVENGMAIAYDIAADLAGLEVALAMEMHMWPRGNAGVSVMFFATQDAFDTALVASAVRRVDGKLSSRSTA